MTPRFESVIEKFREADFPGWQLSGVDGPRGRFGSFGQTMLHVVAVWGDVESGRILIEEGALLDVAGEHGCTPLHEATLQGHSEMVRLLLDAGSNPDLRCEYGTFFEIAENSACVSIRDLGKMKEEGKGEQNGDGNPISFSVD